MEDLTTQKLVRYTLQVVNREYEDQAVRILGQQGRRPGYVDTPHRTRIQRKRVIGGPNEGFTSQGGSERTG